MNDAINKKTKSENGIRSTDEVPTLRRSSDPPSGAAPPPSETLVGWHEAWLHRLDRLLLLSVLATLFYMYFGLVSPMMASHRLGRLENIRSDLQTISYQFLSLRDRYIDLVSPRVGRKEHTLEAIRRFEDHVLPALEASEGLTPSERDYVTTLKNDMVVLRDLVRDYTSAQVLELPGNGERNRASEEGPNGPVQTLANLEKLELVILNLKSLETRPENWSLCERVRDVAAPTGVRLADNLTLSFSPYDSLAEYTPARDRLLFKGHKGLGSYSEYAAYLGATFEARRVQDLARLEKYVNEEIDTIRAGTRSPVVEVPVLDASVDRLVVLSAFPLVIIVLLHAATFYANRGHVLYQILCSEAGANWIAMGYVTLAPRTFFDVVDDRGVQRGPRAWEPIIRDALSRVLDLLFRNLAIAVAGSFIINVFLVSDRQFSFWAKCVLLGVSILFSLVIWAEVRLLRAPFRKRVP